MTELDDKDRLLLAALRQDSRQSLVALARHAGLSRSGVHERLRRLEAKGMVRSRMGEATAERGGRAKRYFTLTRAGHQQLHASRTALLSMWANHAHKIRKAKS